MNIKQDFKNLYKSYQKNAIKKSLFYSLVISFTALFITSFIFWIVNVKAFWIAFIGFAVLEIILFLVFYLIYKPSDIKFARELDSLGLKQRVITMYDYQNDDSLMATIQRQNAIEHVNKVDTKLLRFVAPMLLIVFMVVSIVLGVSASTVSVLGATGVIKSGKEAISEIIPTNTLTFNVNYNAKKGGKIEGELNQVVKEGEDASPVIAISDHGYIFVSWSDGVRDPYRKDINVSKNLELFASFVTIDEYLEMLKDPGEPEVPEEPESGAIPIPQPGEGEDEAPQRYDDNSKIIDGETYYGEGVYDAYFQDMLDLLSQDTEMSSEMKKIINDYFDTIEK